MENHDTAVWARLDKQANVKPISGRPPRADYQHEGCGNCCVQVGIPPFRCKADGRIVDVVVRDADEEKIVSDTDELPLPENMPAELIQELARLAPLGLEARGEPCVWFDRETRKCKHYEFRPNICRMFNCGGDANRHWRRWLQETMLNFVQVQPYDE
ncbi:MAG: YkgJ family cysteine cluster protein [Pirellulales bacterium]|nr:YkgJ family cysteine cluster protein [Pirellulales bacterium]